MTFLDPSGGGGVILHWGIGKNGSKKSSHNMVIFAYQKFLQKLADKRLGGGGAMLF